LLTAKRDESDIILTWIGLYIRCK